MKRIIVFFFILFSGLVAQDDSKTILIKFKKQAISNAKAFMFTDADFDSKTAEALKGLGINKIEKTFLGFQDSDTIKTTPKGKLVRLPNFTRVYSAKLNKKANIKTILEILNNLETVEYAEEDLPSVALTNDPLYTTQWGLNNTGQSGGVIGTDINIQSGWEISTGSSNIKIGVIDLGVWMTHPDLDGRFSNVAGLNHWHGTGVSGILGANTNNNEGIAGINWSSPLHFADGSNLSKLASAINNCVSNDCDVINISVANVSSNLMYEAAVNAFVNNVLIVSAVPEVGKEGDEYPSKFGTYLLRVGSIENDGSSSPFSVSRNYTDVSAPGGTGGQIAEKDIQTAINFTEYTYLSGTSFSTPHVAGAASLMASRNSFISGRDIAQILIRTSGGYPNHNGYTGYGLIDANSALEKCEAPYGPKRETAPFVKIADNIQVNFTKPPIPNLAAATFVCEKWKLSYDKTYSFNAADKLTWLSQEGYSTASPNTADFITIDNTTSSTISLETYFYYIKIQVGGTQSINKWAPYDPTNVEKKGVILDQLTSASAVNVQISGPSYLNFKQSGTYTATVLNAYSPSVVQWYRKLDGSSNWMSLGSGLSKIVTMGTSAFTMKAVVTDDLDFINEDTHYVDNSFWKKAPGDGDGKMMVPEEYSLGQNFPNPFNPTTTIKYDLKESGFVRLNIYNVKGQIVKKLVNKAQGAGRYETTFDASSLPSGLYYYSLEAGNFKEVKKMILMK